MIRLAMWRSFENFREPVQFAVDLVGEFVIGHPCSYDDAETMRTVITASLL